jgi:LmeA-like phospholipid-binding
MEPLTLLLSSLISLISPVNLVADRVAENAIRAQFKSAEVLKVRVDNAPIHQPIAGKADKVRIAGRGLFPLNEFRIEALEVETDPINVNRRQLFQKSNQKRGKLVLDESLGLGVRMVMKKDDIVRALKSPEVVQQLQKLLSGGKSGRSGQDAKNAQALKISNPQVEFLDNQRIRIEAEVQQGDAPQPLKVQAETGIAVVDGRRFQFVDPSARLNGTEIPGQFIKGALDNLAEQYDLAVLEKRSRIKAKILAFTLNPNQLEIATFVQLPAGFKL